MSGGYINTLTSAIHLTSLLEAATLDLSVLGSLLFYTSVTAGTIFVLRSGRS
jgi:hypothetical protein